jgi:hypothetical protein
MLKQLAIAAFLLTTLADAASAAVPRTCSREIGRRPAAVLVRRCRDVSPATHPPCNALNPCALIRDEIARGCSMLDAGDRPRYCRRR